METSASWPLEGVIYHIFPLGSCNAPQTNDFSSPIKERLLQVLEYIPHLKQLGVTTVYFGPLFESTEHGYDTADYMKVDRRLGTNNTLKTVAEALKAANIRIVLDGVFNHVGRHFWAFKDVQEKKQDSKYVGWFRGLNFQGTTPLGDPFTYQTWHGHYDLVKLETSNPEVREHLFTSVKSWVTDYDIDGLRLDAADQIDLSFLRELALECRGLKKDFWLLAEIVYGDYLKWAGPDPGLCDSVTNYESYKALWSSLKDKNYFELAWAFNRGFGEGNGVGLFRTIPTIYNFADNHDVERVASTLSDPAHELPLLYAAVYFMPGVPSIYYGSEWGIPGKKAKNDWPLRPALTVEDGPRVGSVPSLCDTLVQYAQVRRDNPTLRYGDYKQILVANKQFVFARRYKGECIYIALNCASEKIDLSTPVEGDANPSASDLLSPDITVPIQNGKLVIPLPPYSVRVLKIK